MFSHGSLRDGTLGVTVQGKRSRLVGSWALTDASRAGVERAFAAERCAVGDATTRELLPALRAAFGDPGKGFDDPKKVVNAFKESGSPADLARWPANWPAGRPSVEVHGVPSGCVRSSPSDF
ncbi:hypothetical protein [Sorangium sp. So ce233]|uniref:hypothetical protein n=1 Tax=Sorangium sp. So ce233 TaxID=3133290 RepID=UPI003F5D5E0F